MLLKDYAIPKKAIPLPGKPVDGVKPSFDVRGLCLEDMTYLVTEHLEPITRALALYQEQRPEIVRTGNIQGFVMTLARDFPELAAEVISVGADQVDAESRQVAARLPLSTQIAALVEITRLTMDDAGGLKNLLAEMQARLKSVVGAGAN